MGIARGGAFEQMVGDPDDHRPETTWRCAVDPGTDGRTMAFTVLEERCGVGDRIPLHRHDVDELVIVVSGEGTYTLGGASHDVHEGDVIFVPAGARHGTANRGNEVLHLHAVFPATRVRVEMLGRNPRRAGPMTRR